ncbi:ubiquitin carboxyl-terminal hydrolase 19-like [Notothenia coriiceps]|uniref:Ubiquitin carboxyl-terminal hydrolase 19-like n=1 Tax=Notothenia coriiceps TaxID=8208 RepID=A0A6I9PLS7_9TELE|nr:PREDICTED: ubiquitin carboxyl-terminal hydrolase 19-like [Notothenia coriiceps]
MPADSPEGPGSGDEAVGGSSVGEADQDLESPPLLPEAQAESAQASTLLSGHSLSTTRTADSGFSEPISSASCCSLDHLAEKETSCEKAVRPEAAVTGYQQPSESASGHASQFYIAVLDYNNKEQRLDERGTPRMSLSTDIQLDS